MESIQARVSVGHITAYISLHSPSEQQKVYSRTEKNRKHASVQLDNCVHDSFMTANRQWRNTMKGWGKKRKGSDGPNKTESNSTGTECCVWHTVVDCHLKEVLRQCKPVGNVFRSHRWTESGVKSSDTWLLVKIWANEKSFYHSFSLKRLQFQTKKSPSLPPYSRRCVAMIFAKYDFRRKLTNFRSDIWKSTVRI